MKGRRGVRTQRTIVVSANSETQNTSVGHHIKTWSAKKLAIKECRDEKQCATQPHGPNWLAHRTHN